jgi:hypothetical protein
MIGGADLGLGVVLGLKDAFSANAQKIESSMKSLDATVTAGADRMGASLERIQRGTMMMGAGAALLALPVALVAATAATQKALGEVSSVGVKDLRALEDAAESFTNQWAGSTKAEFITAAYDVKSALASLSDEAVGTFSAMAALTAKASKATTQEMVGTFTTAYGIFKPLNAEMSDIDWAKAFSGAMAQTVAVFKTTGPQMAEAIKNVGATAAASLVPLEEQLAILGQLQTTMPGSEAGTLYKAFIMKAAEAGDELGLSFIDNMGRLKGVIPLLQEIRTKFPDLSQAAAQVQIKKAFGSDEAVKFVLQMSQGMEALQGNIASVAQAMKNGTAVTEEMAQAMNQDIGSQFVLLRQQIANLAEILGRSLLPVVVPVLQGIQKGILGLQKLAKAAPMVTRAILVGAMAMGGLLIVVGGAVAAFGTLGLLLPAIKAGIAGFGAAIASAGGLLATWFWPVAAILAGVALAVYGLKRAWETNFAGIRETVVAWWNKIQLVGQGVRALISSLSGSKGQMSAALAKQLQDAGLMGFVVGVFRAYYRVREFLVGIGRAFSETFGGVRAILEPAVRGLFEAFQSLGAALRPLGVALGSVGTAADAGTFRTLGEAIGRLVGWAALAGAAFIRFLVIPLVNTIRTIAAVVSAAVWLGTTIGTLAVESAQWAYRFLLPIRMLVEGFRFAARVLGTVWDVATGNATVVEGLKSVGEAVGAYLATPFVWAKNVVFSVAESVGGALRTIGSLAISVGGTLRSAFSNLGILEAFRAAFGTVLAFLSGDLGFFEAGRRLLEALGRGLLSLSKLPQALAQQVVLGILGAFGIDLAGVGRGLVEGLVRGMQSLISAPERVLRAALDRVLGAAQWATDAILALAEGLLVGFLRPLGVGVEPIRRVFGFIGQWANEAWAAIGEGVGRIVDLMVRPFRILGDAGASAWAALRSGSGGATEAIRAAVGGVVSGVANLAADGTALARSFWEGFAGGAKALESAIRTAMDSVLEIARGLLGGLAASLASAWGAVPAALASAWGAIRTGLASMVSSAFDGGKAILLSLADGIRAAISAPYDAVKGALARLRNLLPFSDAREGPLSNLVASGRSLLEAFSSGIARAEAVPAKAVEKALQGIDTLGKKVAAPAALAGTLALTPVIAGEIPKIVAPAPAVPPEVAAVLPKALPVPAETAVSRFVPALESTPAPRFLNPPPVPALRPLLPPVRVPVPPVEARPPIEAIRQELSPLPLREPESSPALRIAESPQVVRPPAPIPPPAGVLDRELAVPRIEFPVPPVPLLPLAPRISERERPFPGKVDPAPAAGISTLPPPVVPSILPVQLPEVPGKLKLPSIPFPAGLVEALGQRADPNPSGFPSAEDHAPAPASASALGSQPPTSAGPPPVPVDVARLLAETRGPGGSNPDATPGGPASADLRQLLDAILRKLDALADRPISLSITTKLDGREIARAVYQDLRERRVRNYETL